jgi:hypothetical protein
MARPTAAERFAQYVDTNGPISLVRGVHGRCHLWTGGTAGRPLTGQFGEDYGKFWDGYRKALAHRFAYELAKGPIPAGLQADHRCRRRNCANPEHLEAVTGQINSRRSTSPFAINARKTTCDNGHDLTDPANTIQRADRPGHRECRACKAERERVYKARNRAAATANITPFPLTTPDTRKQAA